MVEGLNDVQGGEEYYRTLFELSLTELDTARVNGLVLRKEYAIVQAENERLQELLNQGA